MRVYQLDAVVNNEYIVFNRQFNSRIAAIDYMFDYLEKHYVFNAQLEDEYAVDDKHNIHYVLNNANSFNVRSFQR